VKLPSAQSPKGKLRMESFDMSSVNNTLLEDSEFRMTVSKKKAEGQFGDCFT